MSNTKYDCLVIGSGPGGYVAAIRAAQLGLKTAVIEREAPGGICLNWGCIPTKALLKSAEVYSLINHSSSYGISTGDVAVDFPAVIKRSRDVVSRMSKGVQFLFRKNKIDLIQGHGRFLSSSTVEVEATDGKKSQIEFSKAIIATGARARTFPNLPVDGKQVVTYREAMVQKQMPTKLLVIGAGAIGVEFAYFYSTLGADVTIVEMLDHVLPIEDHEVSDTLEKSFKRYGINIKTSTQVEKLETSDGSVSAQLKASDGNETWNGDLCLVAVGVQGNSEDLGLENLSIAPEKSYIQVNEFYQTSAPNIYAIGDIIGAPWLAHVASHEGIIAAEHMAGKNPHPLDYQNIPGCTYCKPQVASIGITEQQAIESGKSIRIGRFPFVASGKAVASGETEGFVKVIIEEELEEVLGVHIIHPEATELLGEASVIRSHEGVASSVLNTIHAHPTLSEGIMEAMADALGRAIHT
jgi:dihydrolipoamide dehydrogenase